MIQEAVEGNRSAVDLLFPVFYDDLHRIARSYFTTERADHTLQPTAIVHEAYLSLMQKHGFRFESRAHFLGLSAILMRRILIDHARAKRRVKRGGKTAFMEIDEELIGKSLDLEQMLDLDAALKKLESLDSRQARIVELRFFGGLAMDEVASALNISLRTTEADWYMARAWLRRELEGQA
jgi:RNA polymerase sigma factor (TIGR02999 family)